MEIFINIIIKLNCTTCTSKLFPQIFREHLQEATYFHLIWFPHVSGIISRKSSHKTQFKSGFYWAAATFADLHLLHRFLENKLEGKIVAVWGLKERF